MNANAQTHELAVDLLFVFGRDAGHAQGDFAVVVVVDGFQFGFKAQVYAVFADVAADHFGFLLRQNAAPVSFLPHQHSHGDVAGEQHFGHFNAD